MAEQMARRLQNKKAGRAEYAAEAMTKASERHACFAGTVEGAAGTARLLRILACSACLLCVLREPLDVDDEVLRQLCDHVPAPVAVHHLLEGLSVELSEARKEWYLHGMGDE